MDAFIKIIKKNDVKVDIDVKNDIDIKNNNISKSKKTKTTKKVKIPKGAPPTNVEFSKFTPVKTSNAPTPEPWEDEADEEYASVAPNKNDEITDSNDIYIRQDDKWKEMTKLDDDVSDTEEAEEIYDDIEEQEAISDSMSEHGDTMSEHGDDAIYSETSVCDSDMDDFDIDNDNDISDLGWITLGTKKSKSNNGFFSQNKSLKTKIYEIPIDFDNSDF
jgi:hypothetical protein